MAVKNFIPQLWAAGILKERDKVMIAAKHCTTEYEGQIRAYGDRVKILTVGPVKSYDYVRNADINAPDELTDEAQWLDIDQMKYCHVAVDDVDKAQANENLFNEAKRQIGMKMADDVDQSIFGLYTQISAEQTINAYTTPVTSTNIISYLATLAQKMQEANVPDSETKYLEVSPAIYNKLVLARIGKETMNTKVIDNAEVPIIYGFAVFVSNNIPIVSGRHKCFVRTKKAIAFASQITETEAYRPERRFSDAVKSLQVWGRKIIRPKELFLFDAAIGAEV